MKTAKALIVSATVGIASLAPLAGFSQTSPDQGKKGEMKAEASKDLADGEVRKVEKDTGKVTIKHGEITSLGMPPMTMVFQVKDKAMVDKVKTGDKIKFKVVNENGKMIVTEIHPEK